MDICEHLESRKRNKQVSAGARQVVGRGSPWDGVSVLIILLHSPHRMGGMTVEAEEGGAVGWREGLSILSRLTLRASYSPVAKNSSRPRKAGKDVGLCGDLEKAQEHNDSSSG